MPNVLNVRALLLHICALCLLLCLRSLSGSRCIACRYIKLSEIYVGRLEYGYEYFGLHERLVLTPRTDKIYLAIAHAISMQMDCILLGRATSGKSEMFKDLAKICATFSVINNCYKFTDFKSIYTILIGLIQCGGWLCLTNFCNMNATVINAISMPIHTLKMSLMRKHTKFIVSRHRHSHFVGKIVK